MKKLLVLILAVCFTALSARAESKQVTTLTTGAAAVIVIPGQQVIVLTISNVGANAVNLTFDGGSAGGGTDPTTGATGRGQPLAAGQTISFYGPYLKGLRVTGVMQTGTTTLNITTNAAVGNSTFPTP
jgi:hypothetical protein